MKRKYIVPQIEQETMDITYSILSSSNSDPKAALFNDAEVEEYLNLGESTGDANIFSAD